MNIYLVTNTTGFPNGTAAAKRIRMIGKALIASGSKFSVYTSTLKDNNFNRKSVGEADGIHYKYLHGTTALQVGKFKKIMLYLKSIVALIRALKQMDPAEDIVYIYSHGDVYNVVTILLCKFFNIRVVEEINEWDYEEMKGPLRKFIFRGPMVKWVDGAIVISKNINENVLQINPYLKTLIVPVLDDPEKYHINKTPEPVNRYCFWMGLVDGYIEDVLFIIECCGLAYKKGCVIELVISGPCNFSLDKIKQKARSVNYPEEKIRMVGYVSEEELNQLCTNAFFYIAPLWNTQKSVNRFPTKIASFMFSGKPVLTCNIGEVGNLLSANENVLFYEPGDSKGLAEKIDMIYNDPEFYIEICNNTKKFALKYFSYDQYAHSLEVFFSGLLCETKIISVNKTKASHA